MHQRVEEEWAAAVADSGLPTDKLLIADVAGAGLPDGRGAVYWSPNAIDLPSSSTPDALRELLDTLGS